MDKALFERRREYKRDISIKRCPLCGRDTDTLFPENLVVSKKTYNKLLNISANNKNKIFLTGRELIDKRFVKKYDEYTLKFINGYAYKINLEVCRNCLEKIGYRHKYLKKHKDRLIATKTI